MQQVPAEAHQATPYPVPLDNQPGCRSISDDDLCAWYSHLCYRPGEVSLCQLVREEGDWPACFDVDGYAQSCLQLHLILTTPSLLNC
ncbi:MULTISPECIES: hypothetical protein [unclassified Serratia (in: enterobacteria)]|uniref:hypothetical protein n=1 Tax=unclassified Serratia (in: enterobacteria) TaxID=2647522 RepID=UPI000906F7DC|nr:MULTISPECIES: hypothetical protein [unclassified Serratia (in: enterobacteria)]